MSDFEAKVYRAEDTAFSEEERSLIESIGKENPDYCATAILQKRYPNLDVTYHESNSAFEINGERMEMNFELTASTEDEYSWISEVIFTLEMFFELAGPAEKS